MTSSPRELGELLDSWHDSGRAHVLETGRVVIASALDAASVAELHSHAAALTWAFDIIDGAQQPADIADVEDDMGPYAITVQKPQDGADLRLLTVLGFRDSLGTEADGVWQLAFADASFSSGIASFHPWGGGDVFSPSTQTKSPLDLVREATEVRLVPADIRKWLLRAAISDVQWQDRAFQAFAAASALPLIRSLSSEVIGPNSVVFNGPPRLNLALQDNVIQQLGRPGYVALHAAVAWVYEDPTSAEQRHALFAAEAARSINRNELIGAAFDSGGRHMLEGARLSFQLSQSELSREAIKTQGELRKAIADDTAKAADSTRTVAGAIAVSIATGVGLVAARSTTAAEPWVLSLVAGIVGLYLAAVAISGWMHFYLQRSLREQWRQRFYRFIPAEDYTAMVLQPARASERPYHLMAGMAIIVSVVLIWLAIQGLQSFSSSHQKLNPGVSIVPKQNE